MKLINPEAEIFVPDGLPTDVALGRTTHMAIAAHQDDIEIMAYDGILNCFGKKEDWFCALVATNGAGSPRSGYYASFGDDEIQKVRRLEQKKAAFIGEYGAAVFLDYSSSDVKNPKYDDVKHDIKELISAAQPTTIYTHNLADKHDSHVAVAIKVIEAIRELPPEKRPERLYGCEVWRSLDWVNDDEKVSFDVSGHSNLAAALIGVFDSQVCCGKRYDLATIGRRKANATYAASDTPDAASSLIYGMDLTQLVKENDLDIRQFVNGHIERFRQDVEQRLEKLL